VDIEHNKAVIRRIFEVLLPMPEFPAELGDLVDPEFHDHDAADPQHARGVASIRATHAYLNRRFPGGARFIIEDILAEGDKVAVRWSAGPVRAIAWFRMRDGKIVDRWAIVAGPPAHG
jgi:hypothetical protein